MNKKVLSTVMAGAMLATTVAPAMAYSIHDYGVEEYKIKKSETINLADEIIKKIENVCQADEGLVYRPGGIYQIQIENQTPLSIQFSDEKYDGNNEEYKDLTKKEVSIELIKNTIKNAREGTVIKLIDRGHILKEGKYYHKYQDDTLVYKRYERIVNSNTLEETYDTWNGNNSSYPMVQSMLYQNEELKVISKNGKELIYKLGDEQADFSKAVDSNGNITNDENKVEKFKLVEEPKTYKTYTMNTLNTIALLNQVKYDSIENKEYKKYIEKVNRTTDLKSLEITLKDGYEFSNEKINDEGSKFVQSNDNKTRTYKLESRKMPAINKIIVDEKGGKIKGFENYTTSTYVGQKGSEVDGQIVSKFKIVKDEEGSTIPNIGDIIDKHEETVPTIKPEKPQPNPQPPIVIPPTKPEEKPENKPTMEVVAGDNRYETAVDVANKTANTKEVAENGNLVLVNGNALVDGLAASPLASVLGKASNVEVAPILLTKTDSLPESTKDYIKEVVSKKSTGKVKVYIVGGNAVVSEKVEKELKELGVDVVRSGGSNREETSLKVAELISKNKKPYNTFVVGANGEADAMSIAPVAADREEPIIVSKNGGLSKDGVQKIADLKANATIVGGTEVVSEATEKALKDAKISTSRVAGSNRQKTNAAIIDRYAKNGLNKIIVSKDGSAKKDELVDALTSTSLAVKEDAPIVLATKKISDEQINALKNKADKGVFIYQIGYGVSNNVLETLAAKIGLLK